MTTRDEARSQMKDEERTRQSKEAAARATAEQSPDWRERFLQSLRDAIPRSGHVDSSQARPFFRDDSGAIITRAGIAQMSSVAHLAAIDKYLGGMSVILCDSYREGKTMAAKVAYNELLERGENPGWITEATLFRRLRAGQDWKPHRWQIIDNAFSADNWNGYDSRSDEATELRLRYRDDVVDRIRNGRQHYRILLTCAQMPSAVRHMQEDLRLRWLEIAEVVECRA